MSGYNVASRKRQRVHLRQNADEEDESENSSTSSDILWTPTFPPDFLTILDKLKDPQRQSLLALYTIQVLAGAVSQESDIPVKTSWVIDLATQILEAFFHESTTNKTPVEQDLFVDLNGIVESFARFLQKYTGFPQHCESNDGLLLKELESTSNTSCCSNDASSTMPNHHHHHHHMQQPYTESEPSEQPVDVGSKQTVCSEMNTTASSASLEVDELNLHSLFNALNQKFFSSDKEDTMKPQLDQADLLKLLSQTLLQYEDQLFQTSQHSDHGQNPLTWTPPAKVVVREQLDLMESCDSDFSTRLPYSVNLSSSDSMKFESRKKNDRHSDTFYKLSPELTQSSSHRSSTDSSWSPSEAPNSLEILKDTSSSQFGHKDAKYKSQALNSTKRRIAPDFSQLCLSCGKAIYLQETENYVQCTYCSRRFCRHCSQPACDVHHRYSSPVVPFYHMKQCCAVCAFQSQQRPNCSVNEWHCKFHTTEDLRFVHELRDALPYLSGLFIEIHFSRPPCWRRKFGTRRGNFSFRFYGGIYEARLEALLRSKTHDQSK